MNFNKLKYFIAVADEQNVTKAAQKLYISQPSLSQCIHGIEDDMGVDLFTRGKSNVTLTHAGKIYYQWAKSTLESVRQMEENIATVKSGTTRQLAVGATYQRSAVLFPGSIASFYERMPGCNINVHEESNIVLYEKLASKELDLIFALPTQDPLNYNYVPIMYERLLVAAGQAFTMDSTPSNPFPIINRDQLLGKPIIMLSEKQHLGQIFRKLLYEINYSPKKITECINLETAHRLVKNNVGVTLLPEICVVSNRYPEISYYMLDGGGIGRSIAAIYRKGHPMEREIKLFVDCVKDFVRESDHPFIVE